MPDYRRALCPVRRGVITGIRPYARYHAVLSSLPGREGPALSRAVSETGGPCGTEGAVGSSCSVVYSAVVVANGDLADQRAGMEPAGSPRAECQL